MKWKGFILFLFGGTIIWCFVFEILILKSFGREFFNYFYKHDASSVIRKLFTKAPVLEDRLFLIDRKVLQLVHNVESGNDTFEPSCILCKLRRNEPITFALLCPKNTSLEEHVLLAVLKAWELGFWVESIISSRVKKFSVYHTNMPLGFILRKDEAGVIVEIVLLHEREGDFWWHGSFYQDVQYVSKFENLGISHLKNDLVLSQEGALDKFSFKSTIIDGSRVNVPKDIPSFLKESTHFIECNYEVADKYYKTYGKDTTPAAVKFIHKARKILSTAKAVLDDLKIPFWISSGTLLGYYRQCDVIPYSHDVDIGVFIRDYNKKIISKFKSARLKLKSSFGREKEGLELSFVLNKIKLDIFFYYDDGQNYWNAAYSFVRRNKTVTALSQYKYIFRKFTLCWTEFLELKVRIPCETETFIRANYGPKWFVPVRKWNYIHSAFNSQKNRIYEVKELKEVVKLYF